MSANQPQQGHEWILANLGRYVNHQMSADETNAVVQHLATCPICQQRLAVIATNDEVEKPLPASPAPGPGRTLKGYDLIDDETMQELLDFKSDGSPVLSVYLDLSPQSRPGFKGQEDLKNMLGARQHELADKPRDVQRAFQAQAERLMNWFRTTPSHRGRGLAAFTCANPDLFRVFQLPMGGYNQVHVSDRPYLEPILAQADEFERYLIMLVDRKSARILVQYMGAIQEYSELTDEAQPRPKAGGQQAEKNQRTSDMHTLWHIKRAVDAAETIWAREDCDWLIIGGAEEALADLREQLPKALEERLAGEIAVSVKASNDEVLQEALKVEQEHEREQEGVYVDALLTKALGNGPGVVGLDNTLEAIVEGNVLTLVIDETLHQPGFDCPTCHFLGSTERDHCPLCGSSLDRRPDIVERALGRALADGANIEILRTEDARKQLQSHGRIGAFLRYSTTSANQPNGGVPGPA